MFPYLEKCEPPSDDKRWKTIAAAMKKLGNERHALIETLHSLQRAFGYLDKRGLTYVAASLKIPLSKVYGVATFYNLFTMKPPGEHSCVVCTGTACYIKGAPELLRAVSAAEGIEAGETTADGRLSLSTARCYGVCGVAPLVVMDDEVIGPVSAEMVLRKLQKVAPHGR